MKEDFKLGLRLVKYSYNFKMNIVLAITMAILGVLGMILEVDSFVIFGTYCLVSFYTIVQMSTSLLFAQMASASPKKRYLELTFPTILSSMGSVFWYLIFAVMAYVLSYFRPQLKSEYNVALIITAVFMGICTIYFGACYKYFMAASILFGISYFIVYAIGRVKLTIFFMGLIGTDSIACFTVGLLILLAGCTIAGLLRMLLYKKKLSPYGMGVNLRKAMQ